MLSKSQSLSELIKYEKAWDSTSGMSSSPLLSFSWFRCCEDIFHVDNTLILSVHEDEVSDNITACAVFNMRNQLLGTTSFEIAGTSILHEPSGLIFQDQRSLERLIQGIADLKSPIMLSRIPFELDIRKTIKHLLPRKFLIMEKNTRGSQFLKLEGSIQAFEDSLSSRRRADLRRARKKAESQGKLTTIIVRPTTETVQETLNRAFEVENAGWKGRNGSSIMARADLEGFFRCYLTEESRKNKLIVGFLQLEDKPVAMQIAVEHSDRLWLLKIGHREKYHNISPGILLTHEMIKYAIESNLREFEFLGSSESWINLWNPEIHQYKFCALYPWNISGIIHLANDSFGRLASRIGKKK